MKNISAVLYTTTLVLALFGVVIFASCNKGDVKYNDTTLVRPCDKVICLNGGSCVDGYCYCPVGYEGLKCETRWNEKFVGTYKVSDECYTGQDIYYTASIQANSNNATQMTLTNVGAVCPNSNLLAVVKAEKTSFEIPFQKGCGDLYIYGNGNINPNLQFMNVYLSIRDSINHTTSTCSLLMTRQ
ncbi:MAG: calcium-binding EGF-like domain-containing protein [Chitinophagaceae bacterium]